MVCSSKFLMILSTPFPLLRPLPSAAIRLGRRSKTLLSATAAAHHPHLFLPYPTPLQRHVTKSQIHTQALASEGHDRGSSCPPSSSSWYERDLWLEWAKLVESLKNGGYYYSGRRSAEGEEDGDEFDGYEGLPEEFVRDSEACLAFARARPDALR